MSAFVRTIRARRAAKRLAAFRARLPVSDAMLAAWEVSIRRAFAVLPTPEEAFEIGKRLGEAMRRNDECH